MELEHAQLEDLPELIEWEKTLFGADAWSPELMVAEVSYPLNYYLVARNENRELVGYAGLRVDSFPAEHADIQTIAVVPSVRRSGLGRRLLQALLDRALESGARDVFLEVRADNEAAIGLYRGFGFDQIDVRPKYYQPEGVDALVMRMALAGAKGRPIGHA